MRQRRNPATPEHPDPEHILPQNQIEEFGLEEAPADIGPSWEEIIARRTANETN